MLEEYKNESPKEEVSPQENEGSKIFWPEKNKFNKEKTEYVETHFAGTIETLRQVESDEEKLSKLSEIVLRGYYVLSYMIRSASIKIDVPIEVDLRLDMPPDHGASCISNFSKNGVSVSRESLLSSDLSEVELSGIHIMFNVVYLREELEKIYQTVERFKKRYGETGEETKYKESNTEELAIHFERIVIEEMAHAFYWASISRDNKKFKNAMEEQKKYDISGVAEFYDDTSVEKRAALWYRSYLKKYYPDSAVNREELYKRKKQQEREENKMAETEN